MANIEELQRALRQGSDAKARLSGLDEQYQQAQDRGVATTKKDKWGQVSPLSVLADVVGQSRSRRDMRELAPQREAARSSIAQHENAQGLFNARVAANKVKQDQDNYNSTASALVKSAALANDRSVEAASVANDRSVEAAGLTAQASADQRTSVPFHDPSDPLSTVNYLQAPDGAWYDNNGIPVDGSYIDGLTPWSSGNQQSVGVKRGKPIEDPMIKVAKPDMMTQILDSPWLTKSTGLFDPENILGGMGYGTPFSSDTQGSEIQNMHMKMADITVDTVKKNLEGLGINPTDRDLEFALGPIPDKKTQPLAWVQWTRDMYIPALQELGGKAVQQGTITPEKLSAYVAKVQASVNRGMATYGSAGGNSEGALTQPMVIGTDGANQAEDGTSTTTPRNAANARDFPPTSDMTSEELRAELNR